MYIQPLTIGVDWPEIGLENGSVDYVYCAFTLYARYENLNIVCHIIVKTSVEEACHFFGLPSLYRVPAHQNEIRVLKTAKM